MLLMMWKGRSRPTVLACDWQESNRFKDRMAIVKKDGGASLRRGSKLASGLAALRALPCFRGLALAFDLRDGVGLLRADSCATDPSGKPPATSAIRAGTVHVRLF
jgi:hypothetical protein